jgi:hypothetical protein
VPIGKDPLEVKEENDGDASKISEKAVQSSDAVIQVLGSLLAENDEVMKFGVPYGVRIRGCFRPGCSCSLLGKNVGNTFESEGELGNRQR